MLGHDRCVNVPSMSLCLQELHDSACRVAAEKGITMGKMTCKPDAWLDEVVGGMATATDSSRAVALGLPSNPPLDDLIRQYIDDFMNVKPSAAA